MNIYGREETQCVLPRPASIIPLALHSDVETVERETRAWLESFPEFVTWVGSYYAPHSPTPVDDYMAINLSIYTGGCHPHGATERLRTINDYYHWFALLDDRMTIEGDLLRAGEARQRAAMERGVRLMLGEDVGPCDLKQDLIFERLLADVWGRLARLSPRVIDRLAASTARVLNSWADEGRIRDERTVMDLDSYLRHRRSGIAAVQVPGCSEVALDIDLTDEYARHPELSDLDELYAEYCVPLNDLYSFRNECARAALHPARDGSPSFDTLNSIAVLYQHEGCTLQEALYRLRDQTESIERKFVGCRAAFVRDNPDLGPDVHAYLTELGHCFSGTLDFHTRSPRYHGLGHDWTDVSGPVVLDLERTIPIS